MSADTRTCPICQTPIPAGSSRRTCSPACKTEAWRREHPRRPAGPARPRPTRPPTTGLLPAALRDCPHCGEPIAIVALLATPQTAGPQVVAGTPTVLPSHLVGAV